MIIDLRPEPEVEGPQVDRFAGVGFVDLGIGVGEKPSDLNSGHGTCRYTLHEIPQFDEIFLNQVVPTQHHIPVCPDVVIAADGQRIQYLFLAETLSHILEHPI